MTQAAEHLARSMRGVAELAHASSNDATRSAVQAAAASLEQFRALDKRVRQYVENNQMLMASDVIFTESLGALTNAAEHVAGAAENERSDPRGRRASGCATPAALCGRGRGGGAVAGRAVAAPVPESDVDVLTAMRALTESAPLRPHAERDAEAKAPGRGRSSSDEDSERRSIAALRATPVAAAVAGRHRPSRSAGRPHGSIARVRGFGAGDRTPATFSALLARAAGDPRAPAA